MHVFEADTADGAWLQAAEACLGPDARVQESRLGPTHELLHAAFVIRDPRQRWVVSRQPAMNPAFALAEVLWILNGHEDAAFLNFWNRQLPRYAGTGLVYSGAYGHRLRQAFGIDQLDRAAHALRHNPDSRQVTLQIWDSAQDLPTEQGTPTHPNVPCNITSLLKIRDGRLDWLQVMRSNDLFLGVPYNLVQFTTLQEILAGWIGVEVGTYTHISDSLHLYHNDVASVQNPSSLPLSFNSDRSSHPRALSEPALAALDLQARQLVRPELDSRALRRIIRNFSGPQDAHNWLRILGAEAARRRGWHHLAFETASTCTNPLLSLLWCRWQSRWAKKLRASEQLIPSDR